MTERHTSRRSVRAAFCPTPCGVSCVTGGKYCAPSELNMGVAVVACGNCCK